MLISLIHAAFETAPTMVAQFNFHHSTNELTSLESVYRNTQNLTANGWLQDRRTEGDATIFLPVEQPGCRSTSVGDYAFVDGKLYRCANIGWEPADSIVCRNGY